MKQFYCLRCDDWVKYVDTYAIEDPENPGYMMCCEHYEKPKPIHHNSMLKFYRTFQPENTAKASAKHYMTIQHKYFRGSNERNSKS